MEVSTLSRAIRDCRAIAATVAMAVLLGFATEASAGRSSQKGAPRAMSDTHNHSHSHDAATFEQDADSPIPDKPGIVLKLAKPLSTFGKAEPIVVRGAYATNARLRAETENRPITRVLMIVARRDNLGAWIEPLIDGHVLPPVPPSPAGGRPASGGDSLDVGFFNVDLRKLAGLPAGPGRYWARAILGDYESERVDFTLQD